MHGKKALNSNMKPIHLLLLFSLCIYINNSWCQTAQSEMGEGQRVHLFGWEAGLGLSHSAHDDLARSHGMAGAFNFRLNYHMSDKIVAGIRTEYEYRFKTKDSASTYQRAMIKNYNLSLITLKASMQINAKKSWYYGAEAGPAYVHSFDESRMGLGLVEEYDGHPVRNMLCTSLFVGKSVKVYQQDLGIALYWNNLYARNHAENFAGLRFNYQFL